MTRFVATVASAEEFLLAEGPVWQDGRLFWVDLANGVVLEGTINGDRDIAVRQRWEFGPYVGAVVPSSDGRLLVAATDRLIVVHPDGRRTDGPRILPPDTGRRLNDGKVDPSGRFLIGTLTIGKDSTIELLERVEDDGSLTVIDDDLHLSNGLAWSRDGSLLYSVDSRDHVIWVRDYDAASGSFGDRRRFVTIDDGLPDGMCSDADDGIWVAIWSAGEVRRFSADGEHTDTVVVAAPSTTSVAFVGPDLDLLLITTAQDEITPEQKVQFPDSGRLFTVRVGRRGLPTTPWSGSWDR